MKPCGILTFQYAHNYGALLQAYALKRFLASNGIEATIINYANMQAKSMYQFFSLKVDNLIDFLRKIKCCIVRIRQYKLFKKFSYDFMGYAIDKPFQSANEISELYESIIVGSDQVWNIELTNNDKAYFLTNIYCENKISYAASFGKSNIIGLLDETCISSLKLFDNLSVRELDCKTLLEKRVEKYVEHVMDPVFLLNQSEWKSLERKPKSVKGAYICLIMLKTDKELINQCKDLSKKIGIETVCIHPMGWVQEYGRQLFDVGPQEFLWLINHAEYVVTNSFHAAAFSVIFDKKLISGVIEQGNNRIASLLNLITNCDSGKSVLDFRKMDKTLIDKKIIKSKNYLLESLKK